MENMNDINHLDPNDEGLKAIMGSRFQDATNEPAPVKPAAPVAPEPVKKAKHVVPADTAGWEPVKSEPNFMDKLMACAKWSLIFGALCSLFFYWQLTGHMDATAAVPSMLACALLLGWNVGKAATK